MKIIFSAVGAVSSIDYDDIWVVGDNDSKRITADFTDFFTEEETTILDYDSCEIIIERANGDTTNTLPMIPDYTNDLFYILVDSWVTDYDGEVSVTVRLKQLQNDGVSYAIVAGGLATYTVQDGILPNGEATITDAQYQALLAAVEAINIDLSDLEDFKNFDLDESLELTDATNILVEQTDIGYIASLSTLVSYLKTKNTVEVADISDNTLASGIYTHVASEFDIVIHYNDGVLQTQVGILGGSFTYRKWEDGAWVSYSDVYAAADHTHTKEEIGLGSVENYGIASQVEAVSGEVNNKYMTPLRTKEAIDAKASNYYTQAQIDAIISGVYKPSGSLSPAEIVSGLLIETNLGNVYNITGEFTSTADFKDGGGKVYAAGTNLAIVIVVGTYMFDVLMGYDIDAQNVIYDGSNVKDEITNLKANKADRIVNRVYYGSSYVAEPGYMVTESPTIGSVTTSATISTENLIFRNYVVLAEAITINLGQLFSFNASLQRTSGGANTTSTVTIKLCKFTGDPTIEVDRDNVALYTPIGSSLPYAANFDTAIYLHKTLAALGTFALEVGDKLCFRVYVNPSATSDHVISNTVDPILLTIPEQGFDYSSDDVVNSSSVDGASMTDVVEKLNDDIIAKGDAFDGDGIYPNLTAGKAYNLEGAAPYLLDEAFDLRVTAGEDTEVTDGVARVKTLEAVVTSDADGVITNITPKPNTLVVTNDNWLKVVENYSYTNKGITVEWLDENTLKFSGTATETGDFAISPFVYSGLTENTSYDTEAKLYANVLSGDIESGNFIEYASTKVIGTDAYATLNLASQIDFALNGLLLAISITNEVSINDLTVKFYTKHASNPNQLWVRPNPLEYSLYTSELVEATDWFKENSINYETKQFTKYWHKYTIDGGETSWSFYGSGSGAGTYVHILELTTDLTDLLLTSVAGAAYDGNLTFIGRASTYGTTNMVAGDIGILYGTDGVNGILFATDLELTNFKAVFSGSYPLPVWIKYLTPTITPLTTITNEIVYPAFNYGLEFGLLGNKLGVEYSSDFQKQITTNLENIIELKATKAETIETSVTIDTTDWVADGVTSTYKAVKTVNGVLASDSPIISFDLTGIADTAWTASRTEFAKIGLASTTDDDEITFYASAIPSEDITVTVKVVR